MNYLKYLAFFVILLLPKVAGSQTNIDLEKKVSDYLAAETSTAQYDALAELMEFNANVSLSEAEYYFKKYNSETSKGIDKRFPLLSHFIAADALYYNDQIDSALYHYLTLASEARLHNENMLAASGLGNASYVLSDLGDKLGAIRLLKQNSEIAQNTGDIRDYTDYTYNIANSYSDLGIRDSAIHYFEKTIDIDRVANNKSGMLYNMHVLLEQYIEGGKISEAYKLCEECFTIAEAVGDHRSKAQCYSAQAVAYFREEKFKEAEEAISNAIKIDENRNDETRMSQYFRIYGNILSARSRFVEANAIYDKSIALAKRYSSTEDLIEVRLDYARSLLNQANYLECQNQAMEAQQSIREHSMNRYKLDLLQLLGSLNLRQGKIDSAYSYKERESAWLAKNLLSKNLLATNQSKNSYDLFKMENVNRALTAEKELVEAKIRRRNILILTSAVILLLLGGLAYFAYQNQMQKSRLVARDLEFQVVEKELLALRSQMNPHFLFNSLNSINDYIMHEEPRKASRYLTKFSNLMRTILNNSKERLITLDLELEALALYVEMENLRFTNSFDYMVMVDPDIDVSTIKIPSMLLQPYAENAIKHGLRNSPGEGILKLEVRKNTDQLEFEIYDNGIGRQEAQRIKSRTDGNRKSHGMNITSDRISALNKIYDMKASIEIVDHLNPTGTSVIIKVNPKT